MQDMRKFGVVVLMKDKENLTLTKQIKSLIDPIVKMSELLRMPIDWDDGKIQGDGLIKIVNQYLIREINKGDVTIPTSIYSVFKQLDSLDYDLALIFNSLNELNEKDLQVFYLLYFKKMTQHEVAKKLGTSRSSVQRLKANGELDLSTRLYFGKIVEDG